MGNPVVFRRNNFFGFIWNTVYIIVRLFLPNPVQSSMILWYAYRKFYKLLILKVPLEVEHINIRQHHLNKNFLKQYVMYVMVLLGDMVIFLVLISRVIHKSGGGQMI